MEDILKQIITGLPNLAVALLALWWLSQRVDRLMALNEKMLLHLLEMEQRLTDAVTRDATS